MAMTRKQFDQVVGGIYKGPIYTDVVGGPVHTSGGSTMGVNISIAEALQRSRGNQEKSAPERIMAPSQEVVDIQQSKTEAERIKKAAHREQARARIHNHLRGAVDGLNSLITAYIQDYGDDVSIDVEDGRIVLYVKTRIA